MSNSLRVCAVAAIACTAISCGRLSNTFTFRDIGAEGGTISYGDATLVIPAGALTSRMAVAIVDASDIPAGHIGRAYEITPAGVNLRKPAALTIRYDAATLPEGTSGQSLQIAVKSGGSWSALSGSTASVASLSVTAPISMFAVFSLTAPLPHVCDLDTQCPAGKVCRDHACVPGGSGNQCTTMKGACVPTATGCAKGAHRTAFSCGDTPTLVAEVCCMPGCAADMDCESGQQCKAGTCTDVPVQHDDTLFWNSYSDEADVVLNAAEVTYDGSYILAGSRQAPKGASTAMLLKVDKFGALKWQKTYTSSAHGNGLARAIKQAADGGYVFAGVRYDAGGTRAAVITKVDAAGAVVWGADIPGAEFYSVVLSDDGGFVAAGTKDTPSNEFSLAWIVKFTSTGDLAWQRELDAQGHGREITMTRRADGYLLYPHVEVGGGVDLGCLLSSIDLDGSIQWQKDCSGETDRKVAAAAALPDNGLIVGGLDAADWQAGFWLMKLDASGAPAWQKTYAGTSSIRSIAVTPDGGYIVVSQDLKGLGVGAEDALIMKLDANGAILWQKVIGNEGKTEPYAVRPAPGGGFVVAGMRSPWDGTGANAWFAKIAEDGRTNAEGICALIKDTDSVAADTSFALVDTQYSMSDSTLTPAATTSTIEEIHLRPLAECGLPTQTCPEINGICTPAASGCATGERTTSNRCTDATAVCCFAGCIADGECESLCAPQLGTCDLRASQCLCHVLTAELCQDCSVDATICTNAGMTCDWFSKKCLTHCVSTADCVDPYGQAYICYNGNCDCTRPSCCNPHCQQGQTCDEGVTCTCG